MPVALIECAGFFQQAPLFIGERRKIAADMHSADHGVCHRKDKIPNSLRAVGPGPYTALGRVDEFRHVCGKRTDWSVIDARSAWDRELYSSRIPPEEQLSMIISG